MAICTNHLTCVYSLTWIGLVWFIIIPFEVYFTINMFKYRYHPGAQARYPEVVIFSAIFSMIHQLICEQFYYLSSGVNLPLFHQPPAPYIASIIFPPLLLIMIHILIFRVYLIHFNINYAFVQATRDWQSLLCEQVRNNDFYTRNHATFGNWKYASRYFIVYTLIACGCEIGVTVCEHPKLGGISHTISQFVYIFWSLVAVLIVAVLYAKIPKFEDAYYVKTELKQTLLLGSICMIIYIVMLMFGDSHPVLYEIQTTAITLLTFGTVVISEYIILNKIKQTDGIEQALDYGLLKSNIVAKHVKHVRNKLSHTLSFPPKSNRPSSRQLFNVLIASSKCINFYVRHLRSEFCIENLLSFIELIEWLYNVTDRDFDMFDIRPLPNIDFELSSAIPTPSYLIYDKDNLLDTKWDWQQSITFIYKKYVHSSAEYQVNLPYEIQNTFANLIQLLSINQATENGTYKFKNLPTIQMRQKSSRKPRFWDNFSSKNNVNELEHSMLDLPKGSIATFKPAPIELDEPHDITINLSYTPTKSKKNKMVFMRKKDAKSSTKSTKSTKSSISERNALSQAQFNTTSTTVASYRRFVNSLKKKRRATAKNDEEETVAAQKNKKVDDKTAALFPNLSAPTSPQIQQKNGDKSPQEKMKNAATVNEAMMTRSWKSLHDANDAGIAIQTKKLLEDNEATTTIEQLSSSSSDSVVKPRGASVDGNDDDADVFSLDDNELIVLDGDYLYGDDYKDPELIDPEMSRLEDALNKLPAGFLNKQVTFEGSTMRSTMRSTFRSTMRSTCAVDGANFNKRSKSNTARSNTARSNTARSNIMITTAAANTAAVRIPDPIEIKKAAKSEGNVLGTPIMTNAHLKPKKLQLSVVHSFRKTLTKVNSFMRRTPHTPATINEVREIPNPEYLKELKMIEAAKDLTVFDFVSVTCCALRIILQLNYQSVTRFKRSHQYKAMCDGLKLEQLVNKHGEKGVAGYSGKS